jgi:hypothetical protein
MQSQWIIIAAEARKQDKELGLGAQKNYRSVLIVRLSVLLLIVNPQGKYPINPSIKSRIHNLFAALLGNTSHLLSEVGGSDSIGFFRSGYARKYVTVYLSFNFMANYYVRGCVSILEYVLIGPTFR